MILTISNKTVYNHLTIKTKYCLLFLVAKSNALTLLYMFDTISSGSTILNLSETPTAEALAIASLCETVKIKIVDLTPEVRGIVYQIPVRFIAEQSMETPIAFLEDVVNNGLASKAEFRYLKKIQKILEGN